jgi:galactokinase
MKSLDALRERFRALFGGEPDWAGKPARGGKPRIFRAPGRVNLIGEHVDYNDGWVLPIAIDRACYVVVQPRTDSNLRMHSEQMLETVECALGDPPSSSHHWSEYVRGVAWGLAQAGASLSGADLLITSEVPLGSGLSSSAALEVASAFALLGVVGEQMDRTALARACQRAENEYVGMRCGIMDQLTACFGRPAHALLIDCRTLAVEPAEFDESQVRVVVANTMVKHALASSEYNRRRAECEEAVERIRAHRPEVRALRDVSPDDLAKFSLPEWPENVLCRARHVTSEIVRVHGAVAALRARDYHQVGRLMNKSHASLDTDYEVSSPELNTMVSLAREIPGCFGARMTGGGFGGCTVNLVRAANAESFADTLAARYEHATGRRPEIYICRTSEGAGEVS